MLRLRAARLLELVRERQRERALERARERRRQRQRSLAPPRNAGMPMEL